MAYGNGGTGQAIGGGSSAASAGPAQTRPPVIVEQMNVLDSRADSIHSLVAELEARISGVLMPEPPATPGNKLEVPHPGVALGASLAQMNDRLAAVAQRLRGIIDRVEL